MTPKIFDSVMQSVEKAMMDTAQPQKAPEPVVKEIECILDEESAWVARPNAEVTKRIALRATLAAQCVMTELALFDAREAMIEGTITPEKASDVLEGLKSLSESAVFTREARDLFKTAHRLIERTVLIDYESAIAAAPIATPDGDAVSATDDLIDRFAVALEEMAARSKEYIDCLSNYGNQDERTISALGHLCNAHNAARRALTEA